MPISSESAEWTLVSSSLSAIAVRVVTRSQKRGCPASPHTASTQASTGRRSVFSTMWVKGRVLLLDIERGSQGAGLDGVEALELLAHRLGILAAGPLHQHADAEIHRRADAHADDLGHVAQQGRCAPAADQDVALLGDAQEISSAV